MNADLRLIIEVVACLSSLGVGAWVGNIILKRVRSKDAEQDDLANLRRELWQENRETRGEADKWQTKYFSLYSSVGRLEGLVTSYIKLQARYQTCLLELARLHAQIEAEQDTLKRLGPAPEKEC